jgi:hypothetical protein
MTDTPISLDQHRGMAAQKATELRRVLAEVEADARALRERQEALEAQLVAVAAVSWPEAADKARYLLGLFAGTAEGSGSASSDPDRQRVGRFCPADGCRDRCGADREGSPQEAACKDPT